MVAHVRLRFTPPPQIGNIGAWHVALLVTRAFTPLRCVPIEKARPPHQPPKPHQGYYDPPHYDSGTRVKEGLPKRGGDAVLLPEGPMVRIHLPPYGPATARLS